MWASTVVHLRVGDRVPPFVLAYVDLVGADGDAGPRVLATVASDRSLPPGTVVSITGTDGGDIVVEPVVVEPVVVEPVVVEPDVMMHRAGASDGSE